MSHTPTQHHARHASIPSHVPLSEPTELDLSPSKARAHATTAHAWTQVTTWLAQQLKQSPQAPNGATLPPFERNAATLAYLQELMRANRAADAAHRRVFDAQSAQVEAYTAAAERSPPPFSDQEHEQGKSDSRAFLDALMLGVGTKGDVSGEAALASLAKACVALGHIPAGTGSVEAELAPRMLALTASVFELEEQLAALAESRSASEAQLAATLEEQRQEDEEGDVGGNGAAAAGAIRGESSITALRQKTSQLAAQTKHLALKLAEYQDRISVLERSDGGPGFGLEEVKQKEREVAAYRDIVRRLEDRLNEYHGLPPDLEASRAELRRAQAELDVWRARREELFGEMGGT